jgi:hypothetical protein
VQPEQEQGRGEPPAGLLQEPDGPWPNQRRGDAAEARLVSGLSARDQVQHGPLLAADAWATRVMEIEIARAMPGEDLEPRLEGAERRAACRFVTGKVEAVFEMAALCSTLPGECATPTARTARRR